MASQISHVVYGEKVKDLFLKDRVIDEKKFYIGTLFPDIRYLAQISREKTHIENPVSEALSGIENDFELGVYVHSLVDKEWVRKLHESRVFELVGRDPLTPQVLKFLVDQIVYPYFSDWEKVGKYLDDILDEEIVLVPEIKVRRWHDGLQFYFSSPPRREAVVKLTKIMNFSEDEIEAVTRKTEEFSENEQIVSVIRSIYENIFS